MGRVGNGIGDGLKQTVKLLLNICVQKKSGHLVVKLCVLLKDNFIISFKRTGQRVRIFFPSDLPKVISPNSVIKVLRYRSHIVTFP